MSYDSNITGCFDFSPEEETGPIWITDYMCTLFGMDVAAPTKEGAVSLRLMKHKMFGTGGHPSTKAAIWAILKLTRTRGSGTMGIKEEKAPMPSPFLEIGNSTGLLSLVAATAGAEETFCASPSHEAGALAEDNGAINGHEIKSLHPLACLTADEENFCRFGCIATQNGGDQWVRDMIPWFWGVVQPGGWVIYAGHTANEHQSIKNLLGEWFDIQRIDDCCGWPVLVFQKDE